MIPFNMNLFPPSKFSLAEVTKELMEHFLIGLSTLKGHELIIQYKEQKSLNT
jgi:hypothetical protein